VEEMANMENKEIQLLLGHIIPEVRMVKDFSENEIIESRAEEGSIRMSVYNTYPHKVVLANCALITSKDHHTSSGVVHVVDKVMQPATKTLGEILSTDAEFKTFMSALDKSAVEKLYSGSASLTVFAPTQKAFKNLDPVSLARVMGTGSCSNHILRSHIVPRMVCSGAVRGRVQVSNDLGEPLSLHRDENDQVYVAGQKLLMRDVVGTNGVIHVIDDVIIPQSARTVQEELKRRNQDKFLELLEKSGMGSELNDLHNFTLLLPSDEAINQIDSNILESLKRDDEHLRQIVLHHILPKHHHSLPRVDSVEALSGQRHHIKLNGAHTGTVSCARMSPLESGQVCGGHIYSIDRLLVPAVNTMLETLRENKQHSMFYKLIQESQISSELEGPHTIFAPTNRAFKLLSDDTRDRILGDRELARTLINNHIVKDSVCCSTVPGFSYFPSVARGIRTLGGQTLMLRRSHGGRVIVNAGSVERCDTVTTNGILHSVDTVLLPRELQEHKTRGGTMFWNL